MKSSNGIMDNEDFDDESSSSVYGESSSIVNPVAPARVPTPVLVENWPTTSHRFGQVTAVSIDNQGNPVIFHRGDRYWDAKCVYYYLSFDNSQ